MLIVVEGPDGAGKSTLVQSIRQTKKYLAVIQTSGPSNTAEELFRVLHYITKHPPNLLLLADRIPSISERVYGKVLRNKSFMERFPLNTGLSTAAAIVYCRPHKDTIRENVQGSKQLSGVATKIDELVDEYDTLIGQLASTVKVFRYDYETQPDGKAFWENVFHILEVEKCLMEHKRSQA